MTARETEPFWRRAAPHVIGLALVEWAVSFALSRYVVSAIAAPLATHPRGADALFDEDGRIALDVYFSRSAELPPTLAATALIVGLVVLVSVPLQGAMPSLARGIRRNPWAQSIANTPSIVALAVAQTTLFALFALAIRRPFVSLAIDALSTGHSAKVAVFVAFVLLALALIAAIRSTFAIARGAVVGGDSARAALAHGFNLLRARLVRIVLGRLGVDASTLALAAVAAIAPASLAVAASLLAHGVRVALELAWLRRTLAGLGEPSATSENN